jgi:hypothetical protein
VLTLSDPRTDQIARQAAMLMHAGRAQNIGQAIRAATDQLRLHGVPLPGHGRVRQHARAMSMQALGDAGYQQSVHDVLIIAEELMTLMSDVVAGVEPLLVGRAARGEFDADATLHIRLYTSASITELAEALVDHGYEEPAFATIDSRFGRLSRMELMEQGVRVVLTRCLSSMRGRAAEDLFAEGKTQQIADLRDVRRRLEASAS